MKNNAPWLLPLLAFTFGLPALAQSPEKIGEPLLADDLILTLPKAGNVPDSAEMWKSAEVGLPQKLAHLEAYEAGLSEAFNAYGDSLGADALAFESEAGGNTFSAFYRNAGRFVRSRALQPLQASSGVKAYYADGSSLHAFLLELAAGLAEFEAKIASTDSLKEEVRAAMGVYYGKALSDSRYLSYLEAAAALKSALARPYGSKYMKSPQELLTDLCQVALPLFDAGIKSLQDLGISWDYVDLSPENREWIKKYSRLGVGNFLYVSIAATDDLDYAGRKLGIKDGWASTLHVGRDKDFLKRFLAGPGPYPRKLAVVYDTDEGKFSALRPKYDLKNHRLEIKAEAHSTFELFTGTLQFANESSEEAVFEALQPLLD